MVMCTLCYIENWLVNETRHLLDYGCKKCNLIGQEKVINYDKHLHDSDRHLRVVDRHLPLPDVSRKYRTCVCYADSSVSTSI